MGRIQCLHAERSADKIVEGIAARLTKDGTLTQGRGLTPLDLLRDAIAHMLADSRGPNALDAALDVALATNRPLLVSGNPGCGKSRLADAVAAVQGWSLLARTITSRTRLETLTAEVDQLRRLNDAQTKGEKSTLRPDGYYLNPGIFW